LRRERSSSFGGIRRHEFHVRQGREWQVHFLGGLFLVSFLDGFMGGERGDPGTAGAPNVDGRREVILLSLGEPVFANFDGGLQG
jgi:hypothetical protein